MTSPITIRDDFWCTGEGVPSAFRVLKVEASSGEEKPVHARQYLDELTTTLEQCPAEEKAPETLAAQIYASIPVQISLLEERDAIPSDIENDVVVDYWQPAYLAMQLQHKEALAAMLQFHTSQAVPVLRDLVVHAAVEESTLLRQEVPEAEVADDGYNSPPLSPGPVDLLTCEVRGDWGGSLVLLGHYQPPPASVVQHSDPAGITFRRLTTVEDEEAAAAAQYRSSKLTQLEEEFFNEDTEYCAHQVLTFLRPIIVQVTEELKQRTEHGEEDKEGDSFILNFLNEYCAVFSDMTFRPSLYVESGLLFELCGGDLIRLTDVLDLFQGSLTPIFRGKKFPDMTTESTSSRSAAASIAASPMNPSLSTPVSTPRGMSTGRHSSGGPGIRHTPFWFTCPPQDAQRVAFLAKWATYREQASEKPGSARLRRAADMINEYRITLNSHKKMRDARFIPSAAIWSGHMFIISKLISKDCSVEDFMDIIGEGAYLSVLSSNGIPGAVVAVMAACVIAQREIIANQANSLRLLTRKVETLVHDMPNRPSPLRNYVVSPTLTHAERFEELWFGETPYSSAKKFFTRAEMLYYCTSEMVLATAESRWPEGEPTTTTEEDPKKVPALLASLRMWVNTWRVFFQNLKDRPPSLHRRTLSRTSVSMMTPIPGTSSPDPDRSRNSPSLRPRDPPTSKPDDTTNPNEEGVNEQAEALKNVCEMLPVRLEHGRPPLPWLMEVLFPPVEDPLEASLRKSTSIDNEFQRAQESFAKLFANNASNEVKLKFYGLFKQATVGDINVDKPWVMDQVGRAKWESWNKLKGMNTVDAKRMYVTEFKILSQAKQ